MLLNQTIDKLMLLKLTGMVIGLEHQLKQPELQGLSFEDRLGLLVDSELSNRESKKMKRLLTNAKLRFPTACIEDIDFDPKRNIDRSLIGTLAACIWIDKNQHVIIEGPTGAGKTWLACALGNQICRTGKSVKFYKMSRLIEELEIAKGDGSINRFRNQIKRFDVLIIDDWLLSILDQKHCQQLFEVIDDRFDNNSLILTSQHPVTDWYARIGEKTYADSICDRIFHNSHRIKITGDSMRRKRSVSK